MYGKEPYISSMPALTRKRPGVSAPSKESRTARLEARVPASLKKILLEAAELTGHASVSSYIVQILRESASKTVQHSRRTEMDTAESAAFIQSLLAPARPASALQAAFARYGEQLR
jgi:uncharacterized protein (DUF1778 family)